MRKYFALIAEDGQSDKHFCPSPPSCATPEEARLPSDGRSWGGMFFLPLHHKYGIIFTHPMIVSLPDTTENCQCYS